MGRFCTATHHFCPPLPNPRCTHVTPGVGVSELLSPASSWARHPNPGPGSVCAQHPQGLPAVRAHGSYANLSFLSSFQQALLHTYLYTHTPCIAHSVKHSSPRLSDPRCPHTASPASHTGRRWKLQLPLLCRGLTVGSWAARSVPADTEFPTIQRTRSTRVVPPPGSPHWGATGSGPATGTGSVHRSDLHLTGLKHSHACGPGAPRSSPAPKHTETPGSGWGGGCSLTPRALAAAARRGVHPGNAQHALTLQRARMERRLLAPAAPAFIFQTRYFGWCR